MKMRETISLKNLGIKAIVYRIFVTCTMFLLAWIWTDSVTFSVGFTLIWNIINTLEYYGFDVIWFKVLQLKMKVRAKEEEKEVVARD